MPETSGGCNLITNTVTNVTTIATSPYYTQTTSVTCTTPICSPISQYATLNNLQLGAFSPLPAPAVSNPSSYMSANSPDCSKLSWQTITRRKPTKRTRDKETDSHNGNTIKKTNNNTMLTSPTYNTNIYTTLNDEPMDSETQNKKDPRPPPIMVQDVTNFNLMLETIKTVLQNSEFTCKTQANNKIKINTNTIDAYRRLIRLFKANEVAHHTYQPREERAYRVVLKNLHQTVPINDIKKSLEDEGFEIRNIANIRRWKNKEPLPMFFIDLEPDENNKKIYDLKYILNTKIVVEAPRKKTEIPQCMRCQEYGHTKRYCEKPYYCVKCGDNHSSIECKKDKNTPAICALCSGPHPANYKGCTVYRELQKLRNKTHQNKYPQNKHYSQVRENISYAAAVNTNKTENKQEHQPNDQFGPEYTQMSKFLSKFEEMFSQLMQQNTMIINLLTTLVNKKND